MIQTNFDKLRRKKAYEENRNIPIRTIAEEAGLSVGAIVRWNRGIHERIDCETLNRLCQYFDCSVGELVEYVPDE